MDQYGGRANLFGVLSAVLGALSVVCCLCTGFGGGAAYLFTLVLAVPSIVLGILHLRRVKRGQASNQSLAVVGIVLGVIGLVIAICGASTTIGGDFHRDIR